MAIRMRQHFHQQKIKISITIQGVTPLLQVFDMSTSVAFYRDKIGFDVVDPRGDDVDWAWLKLNDAEIMLNTAYEKESRAASP